MTRRDWRAGELTTLLLALVLAVAALTSVGFLADRMHQGLTRDARQMLGADLRIRADQPIDPAFFAEAERRGLRTATTAIFPSMAAAMPPTANSVTPATANAPASGDPVTRLVAVKAVSPAYPLRGALTISTKGPWTQGAGSSDTSATAVPHAPHAPNAPAAAVAGQAPVLAPGTVWVDPAVLDALKLRLGDQLQLGNRAFTIGGTITRELDRGFSFINFSPRVMLREDDLRTTGLIGMGSRVTYRLLVSGNRPADVDAFEQWATQRIDVQHLRGIAVESLSEGQPQLRETLDRANHFLRLVALLTSLLAAVAIAMAAQRYARRHVDGCAVMRCLGASERSLRGMFVCEFLALGVLGGVLGSLLGFAGHAVLLSWLGDLIGVDLPLPTLWPAAQGVGAGLVLLLGFALPPLFPLTRVPPGRVLRRDWGMVTLSRWGYIGGYGSGIVLFAGLLVAAAGELKLGLIVAGGFAVGIVLFGGIAWVALKGLGRVARRHPRTGARPLKSSFGWRYALASLERRGAASTVQVTALGIALMCLLLLGMTRTDLIAGWRQSTPPDAPNRFVIDIQPDQLPQVTPALAKAGLSEEPASPMIRGRLTEQNGQRIDPDHYKEARVRQLVNREFNLSYTTVLPSDNQVVGGTWYGDSQQPQISMEVGIARDLGIKVGDTLRFEVAGQSIDAPVTSLRKLDWGSFKVNFFVLMPPKALADFPTTFITSFHADASQQPAIDNLVRRFPNLTVIDTGAILAQLQRVLDQVINAVQFLFLFTLAAGLIVLYAALAGSRDERSKESALLRALGASHKQVRAVQFAEFIVVGALSGFLAAAGAQTIGWVLAQRVFDFTLTPNLWTLSIGVAAGLACSVVGGWWSLRSVLNRPALQSLRDA